MKPIKITFIIIISMLLSGCTVSMSTGSSNMSVGGSYKFLKEGN